MARKKINKSKPNTPIKICKRVDTELRRSEAYLAEAQRLTRTGNWVFNISSQQSFWSLEFFRIFDYDPVRTKPSFSAFLDRIHPEDRLAVEQTIDRGVREGHDFDHDYRLMLSNGLIKYIHAVVHPIAGFSGQIRDVMGIVADVSDRVEAESDLGRSAAYLVEAEKISHTGCWARNPTTGTLFWSQEEWRIFGLDPKTTKLSYAMFLQMIHPEDRFLVEETSKRAVKEKKPYDIPFRIVLPGGSIKYIHSVGKPFFEASGDVFEYIGVSMDETERKGDEAALQLAQAELARVARLTTIGELAASIAHEINQPLSAIATNGRAAQRWLGHDLPNVSEATKALGGIIRDANRASDVISRIRALLKHQKPEYIALDINDIIREVLIITQTALQSRLVSVQSDLPAGLPSVLGDRVQLQQVIMNLIMNGADAMSAVTSRPRILRIASRIDPSGCMAVVIEDSGTGLDASLVDRIFDPLFTTKPNGMGMGLSICKSIVEAHGGRIWTLPSDPNGSVFQFTVPIAEANGDADLTKAPMISIIDDDPSVRAATDGLVRSLGYRATTFGSAEDYLQSDRINDTSCVITDVQLPGLSGVELQSLLLARGNCTPMIFVTGFPEEKVRRRVLEVGAIGFLSKPFDDEQLIEHLQTALRGHNGGPQQ